MSAFAPENSILHRIAARVKERVEEDRAQEPADQLTREIRLSARLPHDFAAAFREAGVAPAILAEVKLASPSEGVIAPGADPVATASDYLAHGARALSILTERDFFQGSPAFLRAIRARHPEARLLMKDFLVDDYQLLQARRNGADCVLLIMALLGPERCQDFLRRARELGLSALVEVHDEEEMGAALQTGATFIGVNNRNLKTMEISLETSEKLIRLAPPGHLLISESGLKSGADLRRLGALGYRGFLIGTSLMKTGEPGAALARLLAESRAHAG